MGVKFDKNKKPILKNKAQAKAFSSALAKEGRKMGKGRAANIMAKVKGIQRAKRKRRPAGGGYRIRRGMLGESYAEMWESGPNYSGADVTDGELYSAPDVNSAPARQASIGFGWA